MFPLQVILHLLVLSLHTGLWTQMGTPLPPLPPTHTCTHHTQRILFGRYGNTTLSGLRLGPTASTQEEESQMSPSHSMVIISEYSLEEISL